MKIYKSWPNHLIQLSLNARYSESDLFIQPDEYIKLLFSVVKPSNVHSDTISIKMEWKYCSKSLDQAEY